ncbi:MAG: hypothetical protein FWF99_00305 [Desulfovibrionaceae bacterium]|nr:hypothetical protein [Desulfovibrionaceae bacterium]
MISFYPFMYILVFHLLTHDELLKSLKFIFFFSLAHLAAIAVVLALPVSLAKNNRQYNSIILSLHSWEIVEQLKAVNGFTLAATSYADAAILEFAGERRVIVFGQGSHHARHDDLLTDFRALAGGNILILRKSPYSLEQYAPFFRETETERMEIKDAIFYLIKGYGFDYETYRKQTLIPIKEKYYRIPAWLPMPTQSRYFFNRYFEQE